MAGGALTGAGAAYSDRSRGQPPKSFVAEPLLENPAGSLARMGEVPGKKLEGRGLGKACVVLGQLLLLKKDEELFREWLKDMCGASTKKS